MNDNNRKKYSIFMLAEDPGGANCLASLHHELSSNDQLEVHLFANGPAKQSFSGSGLSSRDAAEAFPELKISQPDLVVLGTSESPDSSDKRLLLKSAAMGIPTLYVIDYWTNIERRLADKDGENPLYYKPGWLAVIDNAMQEQYARLGFPQDKIIVCGHPHLDSVERKKESISRPDKDRTRQIFPGISPDRPVMLFAAETLGGGNEFRRSSEYSLHGRGDSDERTLIVLEELIDACKICAPEVQIVVRPHPKNKIHDFDDLASEIACFNREGTALEAALAADLVTGMTSMLLLEAVIMNRPVLSIVPREKEHAWLASNLAGASICCWTNQQIRNSLRFAFQTRQGLSKIATKSKNFVFPRNGAQILAETVLRIVDLKSQFQHSA